MLLLLFGSCLVSSESTQFCLQTLELMNKSVVSPSCSRLFVVSKSFSVEPIFSISLLHSVSRDSCDLYFLFPVWLCCLCVSPLFFNQHMLTHFLSVEVTSGSSFFLLH